MTNFFEQVYEVVQKVPEGKVITYGQIAQMLGTRDARRVGHALHSNPSGEVTPCHRVVMKDGSPAPGYAFGGLDAQIKLLKEEGVTFEGGKVLMDKHCWKS